MSTTTITLTAPLVQERIDELKTLGFYVEDMTAVHGEGWWEGMYRWMRRDSDEFQDSEPSFSEADAWLECDRYVKNTIEQNIEVPGMSEAEIAESNAWFANLK